MAWTNVIPSSALKTLIATEDFRCFVRWTLGMSVLSDAGTPCPKCDAPMDCQGHHLVCCKYNNFTRRHGAVQDFVLRLATKAGFTARKEQTGENRTRPGDVFITRLDANGPAAIDVTVRDTLRNSSPLRNATGLQDWQIRQEADKEAKYGASTQRKGWTFIPLVLDCYGGVGPQGRTLLNTLTRAVVTQHDAWQRRTQEEHVWQGLSITLARELARQLVWSKYASQGEEDDDLPPTTHNPYYSKRPGSPLEGSSKRTC